MPPKKTRILKAVRDQVWLRSMGKVYEAKCPTSWCQNVINITNFQCGHNIPESKGGTTTVENLIPICSSCNGSMSNNYTFDEWNVKYQMVNKKIPWWVCCSSK